MHRMLTDGNLDFENRFPPLCNVIFGGEPIYGLIHQDGEIEIPEEEEDAFMILKTPEQVNEIAMTLPKRTKEECRKCYDMIDADNYGEQPNEDDFEYTWEWLQESISFWLKAAEDKRYVLFTVDR